MRKKLVVANWKMNNTQDEATRLVSSIVSQIKGLTINNVEVVISPSHVYLKEIVELTKNDEHISVAAQNCSEHLKGAYTGEVSSQMLSSIGVKYLIVGHSERRTYQKESNSLLKQKVDVALSNNLIPIYCCGERLEERNAETHYSVVENQLNEGLFHLPMDAISKLVIAYEPVWAIGTGVTATAAQAQEMHQFIRSVISKKYNPTIANTISILYGGSCNAANASELFACKDVDGGLVGGVSLIANDFVKIVQSATIN